MLSIGLTGGYATGKSTVAAILHSLGAVVVDADQLAHEAIHRGSPGYEEVLAVFGPRILRPDGEIDRSALGRLVFARQDRRIKLEKIIHPKVIAAMRLLRDEARASGAAVFVGVVPLLFEAGMAQEFDLVWVVTAALERQRKWAGARDGLSAAEIEARIAAQMPMTEKERRADLVIPNDGGLDELRYLVERAWREIRRRDDCDRT